MGVIRIVSLLVAGMFIGIIGTVSYYLYWIAKAATEGYNRDFNDNYN